MSASENFGSTIVAVFCACAAENQLKQLKLWSKFQYYPFCTIAWKILETGPQLQVFLKPIFADWLKIPEIVFQFPKLFWKLDHDFRYFRQFYTAQRAKLVTQRARNLSDWVTSFRGSCSVKRCSVAYGSVASSRAKLLSEINVSSQLSPST